MLKVTEWDCTNEIYLRFSPTLLGILAFGTNVVHSNAIYLRFSTILDFNNDANMVSFSSCYISATT